ncbi:MAG: type II CRISPR-associated endonuclease Cas1 [bacterium]|nr:type II CRISPR-associated endonuclease Cas1 [Candidatus Sumerlaeota bacterium]
MTKRIIEISGFDASLSVRCGQVIVKRGGELAGQFPAEDVGLLIVDTPMASFSNATLIKMIDTGGLVILCGDNHLPAAFVVPMEGNTLQTQRLALQLTVTLPRHKRLWQKIVRTKIRNQAAACLDDAVRKRLDNLAAHVASGDTSNTEGQASRFYWAVYLQGETFLRDREGAPPNHFLNYGYMILRAAMARAICGAGLNPSLGIHHHNRANGFCLADDLIEPFRPWVDLATHKLHLLAKTELDKQAKAALIGVIHEKCVSENQTTSIETAIDRAVASLCHCYEGETDKLSLPAMAYKSG